MLMKRYALLLTVPIFCTIQLSAQTLRHSVAMPYLGLSAYSGQQTDVFAFTGNQAALAQQKHPAVGIYGERRFMLTATSTSRAALAFPTRLGNIGLQLNYAGFTNFNENTIGLAYARSLGKKVDVGIQFNYYGYRIPVYGSTSTINVEAGMLLHFSDKLHGGIQVANPFAARLSKSTGEKLASTYKLGMGYDATDHFFVSAEIVKEENRDMSVTIGAQYQLMQQLFAKVGFVSGTSTGFAGVGLGWKNVRLDVAGSYHPQLGLSPGLMLLINFRKTNHE